MNQTDYEILRLRSNLLAAEKLIDWLGHSLQAHIKSQPVKYHDRLVAEFRRGLTEQKRKYMEISVKGLHPAESDMRAGLFQEAFDELSQRLIDAIQPGP